MAETPTTGRHTAGIGDPPGGSGAGAGAGVGVRAGGGTGSGHGSRGRRVLLLLAAVTLLGLGDLYATLLHLRSVGMAEMNPIAAYLIGAGSVPGLILFKLGCMGVAVGLMWRTRHHRAAELGTWLLFGVMTLLTVHWYQYNAVVEDAFQTRAPHEQSVRVKLPDWHMSKRPVR